MKVKIFIAYKGGVEYAPFDEKKNPESQLIEIAEKYKSKENLFIDVRYFSEITQTWPLIYSYYSDERRFIIH